MSPAAPPEPPAGATRTTAAALLTPEAVYAALIDPRTYPEWLVGCRTIRAVDDGWPAPGTRFHHRVGLVGPVTVDDNSEVLAAEPPRHLALEVRFRPFGRGRVDFWLTTEQATPAETGIVPKPRIVPKTRIVMDEAPIGVIAPSAPLVAPLIAARNRTSLNALVAFLNERA